MYSVHPSIAYIQAILNNLQKSTGKSLEEWLDILSKTDINSQQEIRSYLKKDFALGHTTAGLLAEYALQPATLEEVRDYLKIAPHYVEKLYSGSKKQLRPLHDSLVSLALSLYPTLKISPCKTIVPFYRNHVIAQIKPSSRTRLDFGLCFKNSGGIHSERLIETGGLAKGDRITHKIEIYSMSDINQEVTQLLKLAYELDA